MNQGTGFWKSNLLHIITSYANIYLKEGTMQNKVLNFNSKLTFISSYILHTFEVN